VSAKSSPVVEWSQNKCVNKAVLHAAQPGAPLNYGIYFEAIYQSSFAVCFNLE